MGPKSALFVPEVLFEVLIQSQIARLMEPNFQCTRFIYDELMSHRCMVNELQQLPILRKRMDEGCCTKSVAERWSRSRKNTNQRSLKSRAILAGSVGGFVLDQVVRLASEVEKTTVSETIIWRNGPPEKPVLCNACGSRWRVRRTLDGYIPRHGNIEIESYQRPSDMKPARHGKKLEVGIEVSGQDGSSACLEEEMNNMSTLGSAWSSSDNCMQMEETNEAYKDPLWNPDNVPRRKRSKRRKHILSLVERLHRQLHNILQEPDFENVSTDDENILIYARNKYIPPNEIGLGAMLLVSPPAATEHLTSLSPMTEDNDASCSVNVPVGNSNSNLRSI
ncbi:GATA transcription factor 26-like [Solanum pennellii]|uniref:GATA transcription factor 26-like n=1 Tax=Solanum pennellii TaxID=28526 RepID=A0ABM1HD30_SOLPN|nr:GATA transcription factor 26-like [Solanum pennellii]